MALTPEQQKSNKRLALILATIVAVFFIGFMTKSAIFGI